jgi:hypothetical protein
MRADGLTDMTELTDAFRNFANAPKNNLVIYRGYNFLFCFQHIQEEMRHTCLATVLLPPYGNEVTRVSSV